MHMPRYGGRLRCGGSCSSTQMRLHGREAIDWRSSRRKARHSWRQRSACGPYEASGIGRTHVLRVVSSANSLRADPRLRKVDERVPALVGGRPHPESGTSATVTCRLAGHADRLRLGSDHLRCSRKARERSGSTSTALRRLDPVESCCPRRSRSPASNTQRRTDCSDRLGSLGDLGRSSPEDIVAFCLNHDRSSSAAG